MAKKGFQFKKKKAVKAPATTFQEFGSSDKFKSMSYSKEYMFIRDENGQLVQNMACQVTGEAFFELYKKFLAGQN